MPQKELRVVIGAGQYKNNPEWIQTQETELNLLKRRDWGKNVFAKYHHSYFS